MSSTSTSIGVRKDQEERSARPLPFRGEDRDTLIAELTLRRWESAGMPRGQWEAFWLQAEQEVLAVLFSNSSPVN
jgi:hypothetical protein